MSPWLLLALWLGGLVGSIVAHEAAHVAAGLLCGWRYTGIILRPTLLAVGVSLEPDGRERERWKIAAAGPAATLALVGFFAMLPGEVAASLYHFNLAVAAINLTPIPGVTDGGWIVRGLLSAKPAR